MSERVETWRDARAAAYAYFGGQVEMTLALQGKGSCTADWALAHLRTAVATLHRATAEADAAFKAARRTTAATPDEVVA